MKLSILLCAVLLLSIPHTANAAEPFFSDGKRAVDASGIAGAWAGAIAGSAIGGPTGAWIGGVVGFITGRMAGKVVVRPVARFLDNRRPRLIFR